MGFQNDIQTTDGEDTYHRNQHELSFSHIFPPILCEIFELNFTIFNFRYLKSNKFSSYNNLKLSFTLKSVLNALKF
jgi:hypothetical protein